MIARRLLLWWGRQTVETNNIPTAVDEILSDRFLGTTFDCACGKRHDVRTRMVAIEPNVVERIPGYLPSLIPGERIRALTGSSRTIRTRRTT